MKGFFSGRDYVRKEEVVKKPSVKRTAKSGSRSLVSDVSNPCEVCGLYKGCKSPKMPYSGEGKLGVLIIAEAPGAMEDEKGVQLVGDAGQLLRDCLSMFGLDLDRDFWKTNSIICRPPKNRPPSPKEIKCCRNNLLKVIEETKPKFIWLLGDAALDAYYMGRLGHEIKPNLSGWQRWCIPDRTNNCWVIPMYHPSYVNRVKDGILQPIYQDSIRWAKSCLFKGPVEFLDERDCVEVLLDFPSIVNLLRQITKEKPNPLVFDYETTGLNPYKYPDKNAIFSIGLCLEENKSYSFPFQVGKWSEEEVGVLVTMWRDILEDPQIMKVAHNMKFEYKWGVHCVGAKTNPWEMDTMLMQHILDAKHSGLTGLKTQAFLRWGVENYTGDISWFKSTSGVMKSPSTEIQLRDLCFYNALDALFTYRLRKEQKMEIDRHGSLKNIYDLFHRGTLSFAEVEEVGICVDEDYYEKVLKDKDNGLDVRIERIEEELRKSKEALLFKGSTGRDIDVNSPKDMASLLYDLLRVEPFKFTDHENPSVDEEVLDAIGTEFCKSVVKKRKLEKIKGTYLGQYSREAAAGKIHPSFDLHLVATGRSSSSRPNFQNIPNREKEARETVRRGIVPSPGRKFLEVDYAAIEVRVMSCYSQDPVLVSYVNNPETDMHRDVAADIFMIDKSLVTKHMRYLAKNGFVFPEFYGDWYKSCAESIWDGIGGEKLADGVPVMNHLKGKGFKTVSRFIEHLKGVEKRFWEKYVATREWQARSVNEYLRKGYVDTYFGFRRNGYLRKNQILNTPIQGTAFHCLLWSFIEIQGIAKKENWQTNLVGQIHDSILFDLVPEEEKYVAKIVEEVMCRRLREACDWIIVPMEVEFEVTPVDGSWVDKEVVQYG